MTNDQASMYGDRKFLFTLLDYCINKDDEKGAKKALAEFFAASRWMDQKTVGVENCADLEARND